LPNCCAATSYGMKITLKGTNLELSNSIYQYVYDKIGSLERFVQDTGQEDEEGKPFRSAQGKPPVECWVEVERALKSHQSGDVFRAEAQIKLPKVSGIRAEAREPDLHLAIDKVRDDLQRQLRRFKTIKIRTRRGK
jgi:ribosomal subunit interface protein